jgi:hypothetical protein
VITLVFYRKFSKGKSLFMAPQCLLYVDVDLVVLALQCFMWSVNQAEIKSSEISVSEFKIPFFQRK